MGGESPFVGMLMVVGFNFAPNGWAFCQGQLMPIAENDTLFNLIGTTYGGDGQSTFGIPNLQGRTTIHQGNGAGLSNYVIGEVGGVESVTLTSNQYPNHTHPFMATNQANNSAVPQNNLLGTGASIYTTSAPNAQMNNQVITPFPGGSQPHENRQPFLGLNWVLSLFGVFPSQG